MDESRHEKFKRLATHRTNAVLEKLRLLGNLSSKTNYEYSEEETSKIFSAIEAIVVAGSGKVASVQFSGEQRSTLPCRYQSPRTIRFDFPIPRKAALAFLVVLLKLSE